MVVVRDSERKREWQVVLDAYKIEREIRLYWADPWDAYCVFPLVHQADVTCDETRN